MVKNRNKKCENCNNDYYDSTKRISSRTCSKKCACELGVKTRKQNGSYKRTAEQNNKTSESLRQKYKEGWNPNTPEVVKDFVKRTKKLWNSGEMKRKQENTCMKKYGVSHHMKSKKYKNMFSKIFSNRKFSIETRKKMSLSARKRLRSKRHMLYTFANGGFRKDLGQYFRSGWEANYARLLNFHQKRWSYEETTFELSVGSYTPDFEVEGSFVEIKGKIEDSFKEKFEEFKKLYPHINVIVIYEKEYREISKKFRDKIPNWEGK